MTTYAPEMPAVSLNYISTRALLWLTDQHLALDYARPIMPNEIYVGGLTVKPAKPLRKDLQQFMDDSKYGVIVASFGSTIGDLPLDIVNKMMKAFRQVKQDVMWRDSR